MSLLFMDGFDHYNAKTYGSLKWDNNPGSYSAYLPTGGRRSGGAIQMGSNYGTNVLDYLTKTLPSEYETITVGFAFCYAIGSMNTAHNHVKLSDGSTDHIYLRLNYSTRYLEVLRAPGTVLGTHSVPLIAGTWYYIELKVKISDSTGTVQLRINEYLALDLTGQDTRNGGNASVNKISIGGYADGGAWYLKMTYDDLYVCDNSGSQNDFLGDCRIDTLLPSANGYNNDWDPSTGSNYQCVDDPQFDNGADYVSENTVDEIDSYTLSDLPSGIAGIKGIQTNVFAKRTDSGVNTKLKPILRPVSTNYEKTEVTLASSYYDFTEITELNPETGLAWTKATIDAMEVGLKLTANPLP